MKVLKGSLEETMYDWPDKELIEKGQTCPLQVKKSTRYGENAVTYISDKVHTTYLLPYLVPHSQFKPFTIPTIPYEIVGVRKGGKQRHSRRSGTSAAPLSIIGNGRFAFIIFSTRLYLLFLCLPPRRSLATYSYHIHRTSKLTFVSPDTSRSASTESPIPTQRTSLSHSTYTRPPMLRNVRSTHPPSEFMHKIHEIKVFCF